MERKGQEGRRGGGGVATTAATATASECVL